VDNRNDTYNEKDINNDSAKADEDLSPPPTLSNQQKTLIANTWQLLVENVSKVGVITFMRYNGFFDVFF